MRIWLQTVGLIFAGLSFAQSAPTQIRATGEHRIEQGETEELAKQFALIDATFKMWQQVLMSLENAPEIKGLLLKPNQLAAFIATTAPVQEQPASRTGTAGPYVVEVRAEIDPAAIAKHFGLLRKDQEAAYALVEMWQDVQQLREQLSAGNTNQQQRALALTKIRVKILAAQVSAALAKTEYSLGSARVAPADAQMRAKPFAQTALELGADISDAHRAMGDVLLDDDDSQGAVAEYRKALSIDPASASGHLRLANALRVEGDLSEAVAELREAIRLHASAPAHTDIGTILAAEENVTGAAAEFREALRLDPDWIDAHNGLAIALARQRRMPDAAIEFREMVRIDPDSAMGYYNLASALADLDQDQDAAVALREVLRINPNHYNAHYNVGELFRLEGKLDEAVIQFREYVRLAPDAPQNQRNIERAKDFIQKNENK